ncbi:MAG: glycosyltransferase family 4 protein [Pirellulales bacterium]|nr:glycosyltransferase family 4 protein [Pirellulales bacterium]
MKILHVIARLDGYGIAVQLRMLVDRQRAEGHQVEVLALDAEQAVLRAWREQDIDCRTLDRRWQFDPFTAWKLARILRRPSHGVLHVWDQEALDYVGAVRPASISRAVGQPIIATLWHPAERARGAAGFGRAAPHCLVAPIPCSFATHVIPPGILAAGGSRCSREQFLAQQHLPGDAQLIALAGRLTREKRIEEAIWHFELVRTLKKQAHLLIIGDGPERPRWERFARLASESSAIRFLGYRPDVRWLLSHIDVFWYAGEDDPVSLVPSLDAMAAQVPVVVSDSPTSRTVVEENQSGYLVPLGDRAGWARRTLGLLENKALASHIGAAGAGTIADRYSVNAMIDAYASLYRQLPAPTK